MRKQVEINVNRTNGANVKEWLRQRLRALTLEGGRSQTLAKMQEIKAGLQGQSRGNTAK